MNSFTLCQVSKSSSWKKEIKIVKIRLFIAILFIVWNLHMSKNYTKHRQKKLSSLIFHSKLLFANKIVRLSCKSAIIKMIILMVP